VKNENAMLKKSLQPMHSAPTAIALALAFAFAPGLQPHAMAQEASRGDQSGETGQAENAKVLPAVTVIGTREAGAPLSNVPASISVVSEREIAKQQSTAPRIEDILTRTVPGFNPTNNGVRQIRGRTAQVFINGAPVNEQMRASSGGDLNLLSPWQLGGIEVSRGANSAYGFGSAGGIISLTTPRAESDKLTLTTKFGASVNTNKVGGSQQFSLYQSASQIIDSFDYHVGAMVGYDGLEYDPDKELSLGFRGPSRLGNGKEDVRGLDWSLGYNLGRNGELRFSGTFQHVGLRTAYDADFAGTYRGAQSTYVRTPENDSGMRRSHTQNLTYENPNAGKSAVKLELLNSHVETEAYADVGGRITRDEQTNRYHGIRSSVTTPFDVFNKQLTATYGFDFMRNRYFRPVYFTDTGALRTYFSPDVTLDSYAPYLQANLPVGKAKLTAGVRHEEYRGKVATAIGSGGIQGGDIKPFDITLFNAGAVYQLDKGHDLFATYTQGAEISQLGRAARGAGNTGNLDPQPAKSNQYEVGLRNNGPLSYSIAAFYTESDLMSALQTNPADPTGPLIPLREPRKIWGVESTLNWRFAKQWAAGGTFSWQKGSRVTPTGEKTDISARDVPPLLLSAFVDYSPTSTWSNTLQFDYWGSADRFGNSTEFGEGRIDRVLLAHFSSAFKAGPGELRVGIRNLFNKKYFGLTTQADNSGFYWIPEEGRRISATYTVKW
jgi:iron complex outermembrane receptor protein